MLCRKVQRCYVLISVLGLHMLKVCRLQPTLTLTLHFDTASSTGPSFQVVTAGALCSACSRLEWSVKQLHDLHLTLAC